MAYIPSSSTFLSQDSSSLKESFARTSNKLTHPDLITFLAAVQHRQVDFVPLTWQKGLGLIGRGGTARIGQTHVNCETDFAFKLAFQNEHHSHDEDATHMYEIFITEISILTSPAIRGHPNIANLVGFCWEVTDDNQVYPVIVLEKAKSDLRRWAASFASSHISFQDRLGICVDIANSLQVMHSNNIVHGDLKPENILVFTDDEGKSTAKLTDFGYSSFGYTDNDIVHPSYSEIWSAPECHDRGMELQAAKKNDIYAFGLIATYVLFMECTGEDGLGLETMENAVWDFYLRQETFGHVNLPEWIGSMKSTGRLLDRILEIVSDKVPKEDQRLALQDFFRSTLSVRPEQRAPRIGILIHLLNRTRYNTNGLAEMLAEDLEIRWEDMSHLGFRVSESILSLTEAPYSVRKEIYLALKRRASASGQECYNTCESCSSQAAFEIALCYKIGFGTPADTQRSRYFLSISTKEESDIQEELQLLMEARPKSLDDRSPLAKFSEEGSLYLSDNIANAVTDPKESDLEALFLREISDVDSVLGDINAVTYTLKMGLVTIYEQQGKFQLAESVCRIALQAISELVGDRHTVTSECMDRLACILRENGNLSEAECLQRAAIELMTDLAGKDHIRTKRLLHNFCDTLELEKRFPETAHIREDVFNSLCVILGATHPEVIVAMDKWGLAKRYAGNLKFAATLHHIAFQYAEQDLGPKHSITLICMVNYAEALREQREYEKAETWYERAVEGFEIQYGGHHPKTAVAQHSFGVTLEAQSKWLEALVMYNKALKTRVMVLGENHIDTVASRNAWQFALDHHSKWLVELQQYQDTLRMSGRLTGKAVNETELVRTECNAKALVRQGKLAAAADLYFHSLKSKREASKGEYHDTMFTRKIKEALKHIPSPKAGTASKLSIASPAKLKRSTHSQVEGSQLRHLTTPDR